MNIIGLTGNQQDVNDEHRALVECITETEAAHVTGHEKTMFAFFSKFLTDGANQEFFTFENEESGSPFSVWRIFLTSVLANTITIGRMTSGTPAGTEVAPLNLHFGSGEVRNHTAYGNAEVTGAVAGKTLTEVPLVAASAPFGLPAEGSISIPNNEVIFFSSLAITTVTVTFIGYWHE